MSFWSVAKNLRVGILHPPQADREPENAIPATEPTFLDSGLRQNDMLGGRATILGGFQHLKGGIEWV